MFRTAVIDPPWPYSKASPHPKLTGYSSQHYTSLTIPDLAALPVGALVENYVFLWMPGPFIPMGCKLLADWGFTYRTMMTWQKLTASGRPSYGAGYWFRGSIEFVALGTKPGTPAIRTHERNVFSAKNPGHSSKPEAFQDMVERHFPEPYLELFARRVRPGWTCRGNECPGDGKDIRESLRELLDAP